MIILIYHTHVYFTKLRNVMGLDESFLAPYCQRAFSNQKLAMIKLEAWIYDPSHRLLVSGILEKTMRPSHCDDSTALCITNRAQISCPFIPQELVLPVFCRRHFNMVDFGYLRTHESPSSA
jgi:hypothetical protein